MRGLRIQVEAEFLGPGAALKAVVAELKQWTLAEGRLESGSAWCRSWGRNLGKTSVFGEQKNEKAGAERIHQGKRTRLQRQEHCRVK